MTVLARRWEDLDTFDPADIELLFLQDEMLQASESYPGPTVTKGLIQSLADVDAYVADIKNAVLLPLSDGFIAGIKSVLEMAEEEASVREKARAKRAAAIRRAKANGTYVDWEHADLLAEVSEVAGAGQRRGSNVWFRCPFHEDRNPSLEVEPDKRIWKCWAGCGYGGVVAWRRKLRG